MRLCETRLTVSKVSKSSSTVVDRLFAEPALAELYDAFCIGRRDFDFYLPLVMSANRVLDVGCGTGELLRLAREAGHTGRLCGLDPAEAMLKQARKREDVEWVLGNLTSVYWDEEFDLVVMTGHAFQVLIEDSVLRESLSAIQSALTDRGCFVFETRNPLAKGWEAWVPENATTIKDGESTVKMSHQVESPITGDTVSFTTTFSSTRWDRPFISRSTLRFLDNDSLSKFLSDAGLVIEEQFGDWDYKPLTNVSPEIITMARRGLSC